MSLVATYVLARDGRFYKDPVLAEPPDVQWFICFDDEDPVELVFKDPDQGGDDLSRQRAEALLARLAARGLEARVAGRPVTGMRLFPPTWIEGGFVQAAAFWIELRRPVPTGLIIEHHGVFEEVFLEGRYYDFGQSGDRGPRQ